MLETHAHADHLTGARELRRRLGAPVMIGARIVEVQATFAPLFGLDIPRDGSQLDRLLADGDVLQAGSLTVRALSTPGHTPACTTYLVGDAAFTGDALFLPDSGVGRCDFPGGSADALYTSVHDRLYACPWTPGCSWGTTTSPEGERPPGGPPSGRPGRATSTSPRTGPARTSWRSARLGTQP